MVWCLYLQEGGEIMGEFLKVDQIVKKFGGFKALDDLSFSLQEGEILGLVGPNGSGKTTCINVISGIYKPEGGSVYLNEKLVSKLPSHKIAKLGINRTYQVPKCFPSLTVQENVDLAHHHTGKKELKFDPIEFLGLETFRHRNAAELNSAQQKILDLARAIATNPKLLLVDEIAAGLNPSEIEDLIVKLKDLSEQGIAMIVVEHLLSFVDKLTKRVIVMNAGKEIFEGDLESASKDKTVSQVYLGGDANE